LSANEDDARLRDGEAARLEPDWPEPEFAWAEVYYRGGVTAMARCPVRRVPKTHGRYVEAVFATGCCRLLLGQPDRAEECSLLCRSLEEHMAPEQIFRKS